jgi:hypothetical protein
MRFRLIRICKGEAISAIPQDVVRYDLKASIPTLVQNGYEVEDRDMMLVTKRMADSFYPLLTEEID